MPSHRGTSNHAADGNHGETPVLQLRQLVLLELGRVRRLQAQRVEGVVPRHPVEAVHVGNGGEGACLEEGDPGEDLDHRVGEGVVGVQDSGDALEGVGLPRDADELRDDKADRRQHRHAAVLQLGLAEPREPLGGTLPAGGGRRGGDGRYTMISFRERPLGLIELIWKCDEKEFHLDRSLGDDWIDFTVHGAKSCLQYNEVQPGMT